MNDLKVLNAKEKVFKHTVTSNFNHRKNRKVYKSVLEVVSVGSFTIENESKREAKKLSLMAAHKRLSLLSKLVEDLRACKCETLISLWPLT